MSAQKSQFNRILIAVMGILYVATILWISYANWIAAPAGFYQWWMVLLNFLILSIPLIALYGSICVLILAWREHKFSQENSHFAKILHWVARITALMIIVFISLFSLDVFESEASPLELLGGFIMHNIPSIILVILLLFAWNRPVVGFVGFMTVAILLAVFFAENGILISNLLMFILPIILIGFLFYADWQWKKPQSLSQENAHV